MEIVISELTKSYSKGRVALNEITMELSEGVIGLLGPNGAGKSTLIKVLIGIEKISSGSITYQNGPDKNFHLKEHLGYVPQTFQLPSNLTGEEFLAYMSTAKGIDPRISIENTLGILNSLNLYDVRKNRIGTYSGGMKQRIGIAQALLNHPKLLILDEPTVGLDPDERLNLKHIMTELADDTIILYSTHIVFDIESVANSVMVMNHGELLVQGNTDSLLEAMNGKVWSLDVSPEDFQNIQNNYFVSSTFRKPDKIQLRIISDNPPSYAKQVYPTLEDLYLFYTHNEIKRAVK